MEKIIITPTDETPKVILDTEEGVFRFSGKSFPGNPVIFYEPILDWFKTYSLKPNEKTHVVFKMMYFNTSSARMILEMLRILEAINDKEGGVTACWYFKDDDENMEKVGEEYAENVTIPFEIKQI